MLTLHPPLRTPVANRFPDEAVWIDLQDPTPEETAQVEHELGIRVPTEAALNEIESSSRVYSEHGALYLSMPMIPRGPDGEPVASPLGFVLWPARLVTIRFAEFLAFQAYAEQCKGDKRPQSSIEAFIGLTEVIVDATADKLEQIGGVLDEISVGVFRSNDAQGPAPARADRVLRAALRTVGRAGDDASKIRDRLLGIGRIVPFVTEVAASWIPGESHTRLNTLRQDILSLNDYEAHLSNKVQFLLDATLGFINIVQNSIIKR